jgi:RNA polymerase sigma-70 factor (family 1)
MGMEIQQQLENYTDELEENQSSDFEMMFNEFSVELYNYAFYYLNDMEAAMSVVNDTFLRVWDGERKPLNIKSYLYRSVKNACLNYLSQNQNKVVFKDSSELEMLSDGILGLQHSDDNSDKLLFLEQVISKLPAKRQIVFKLFRFEELSYAEIAERLNISIRTVEDHLAKSMQFIHEQAKHLID